MSNKNNIKLDYLDILNFWFLKLGSNKTWFMSGDKYDKIIKDKFLNYLEFFDKFGLYHWESNHKSCLALIILLDQFPRHIFRDTQEAYKYEDITAKLSLKYYNVYKSEFNVVERLFFLLPLRHSEYILHQELGLNIWKNMVKNELFMFSNEDQEFLKKGLTRAEKSYNIIIKFGRFPERNKIYNRESTSKEKLYLVTKML